MPLCVYFTAGSFTLFLGVRGMVLLLMLKGSGMAETAAGDGKCSAGVIFSMTSV